MAAASVRRSARSCAHSGSPRRRLRPKGGVFRGRGAVVLLDDPGDAQGMRTTGVVQRDVFDTVAFDRRVVATPARSWAASR